ncbi:uncharacterized protein LOC144799862 isoform X1 [Lissotriton helveticus]
MLFSLRKNAEFQKPEVWQDTAGSSGTSGTTAGKDLPGHRTGGKNQTLAERNQRFLSAQIRPHQARRTNIQRRKRGEIITRVYWTLYKLSKMGSGVVPKCPKCNKEKGDDTHMFMSCPAIQSFWLDGNRQSWMSPRILEEKRKGKRAVWRQGIPTTGRLGQKQETYSPITTWMKNQQQPNKMYQLELCIEMWSDD